VTPKQRAVAAVAAVSFVGGAVWLAGRPGRELASIGPVPSAPVASTSSSASTPAPASTGFAQGDARATGDGGTSAACLALEAANAVVLSAWDGGACNLRPPELGCITTTSGTTWGWEVLSARTEDECGRETKVRLVHIDRKGTTIRGAEETLHDTPFFAHARAVRELADYDHDGEGEVLCEREAGGDEATTTHELEVLTFSRGAIGPYAAAGAFHIAAAEDADGDGLPDLVTRGPYEGLVALTAFPTEVPAGPAFFLAHARPDGTFALGDAAALAFTRSKCPAPPVLSFQRELLQYADREAQAAIVCARLWGKPERDVLRALDAVCAGPADGSAPMEPCGAWYAKLAAVSPPFTLR
jgi:hypothetical protein